MNEKTVSNIVIRVWLDATEMIMGTNGLKAVLNYSKRSYILDNYPDYSFDKNYTEDDFSTIAATFQQLLGIQGLKAVLRQIGKASARTTIDLGVYDSLTEFLPVERLFKAAEVYAAASGRGAASMEDDVIVYNNDVCTACKGIRSDVPICSIICGYLDELAAWAGVPGMRTVETHCKATGDATCRYEVRTG